MLTWNYWKLHSNLHIVHILICVHIPTIIRLAEFDLGKASMTRHTYVDFWHVYPNPNSAIYTRMAMVNGFAAKIFRFSLLLVKNIRHTFKVPICNIRLYLKIK